MAGWLRADQSRDPPGPLEALTTSASLGPHTRGGTHRTFRRSAPPIRSRLLSVGTVLLVQGSLTPRVDFLEAVVNEAMSFARTAIGGVLIVGLGLSCSNARRSG